MGLKLQLHRLAYRLMERSVGELEELGTREPWTIFPDLTASSFVVSGGAGYDISFELDLIAKYGCTVALLDPSPPGSKTVSELDEKPDALHFHPYGLAAETGTHHLHAPAEKQDTASWVIGGGEGGVPMEFLSLRDVLAKEHRSVIDLLKIDIEGYEYEVLYSVLDQKLPIRQICVEIHQGPRFLHRTQRDRWRLIFALRRAGYLLVHHAGRNHTFVRSALVDQ